MRDVGGCGPGLDPVGLIAFFDVSRTVAAPVADERCRFRRVGPAERRRGRAELDDGRILEIFGGLDDHRLRRTPGRERGSGLAGRLIVGCATVRSVRLGDRERCRDDRGVAQRAAIGADHHAEMELAGSVAGVVQAGGAGGRGMGGRGTGGHLRHHL